MQKFSLFITVLVLAMSTPSQAISPFFTSTFYGLQNTIERFTHCRAYPIAGSTNASDHLVKTINNFITLANFSHESLENLREFIGSVSLLPAYEVDSGVPEFMKDLDKNGRCNVLENILDTVYPVMRQSAYNRSVTLNLTGLQVPNPINNSEKIPLSQQINALWIATNFTMEEMYNVGHPVVEHINATLHRNFVFPSSSVPGAGSVESGNVVGSTKRADVTSCCSYADWLSYQIDSLIAMMTRLRLSVTTRAIESRMALSSGLSFTKNKLSSGFSRIIPTRAQPTANIVSQKSSQQSVIERSSVASSEVVAPIAITPVTVSVPVQTPVVQLQSLVSDQFVPKRVVSEPAVQSTPAAVNP